MDIVELARRDFSVKRTSQPVEAEPAGLASRFAARRVGVC
jgi:hypothetical protein